MDNSCACTQVPEDPAQWQLGSRTLGILRISRNTGPVIERKETLLNPSRYHVCVCVCVKHNYCAVRLNTVYVTTVFML